MDSHWQYLVILLCIQTYINIPRSSSAIHQTAFVLVLAVETWYGVYVLIIQWTDIGYAELMLWYDRADSLYSGLCLGFEEGLTEVWFLNLVFAWWWTELADKLTFVDSLKYIGIVFGSAITKCPLLLKEWIPKVFLARVEWRGNKHLCGYLILKLMIREFNGSLRDRPLIGIHLRSLILIIVDYLVLYLQHFLFVFLMLNEVMNILTGVVSFKLAIHVDTLDIACDLIHSFQLHGAINFWERVLVIQSNVTIGMKVNLIPLGASLFHKIDLIEVKPLISLPITTKKRCFMVKRILFTIWINLVLS